jgi:hypothetical protein
MYENAPGIVPLIYTKKWVVFITFVKPVIASRP